MNVSSYVFVSMYILQGLKGGGGGGGGGSLNA